MKKRIFTFEVSVELAEEFKNICKKDQKSMSYAIREFMKEYIKKENNKNE